MDDMYPESEAPEQEMEQEDDGKETTLVPKSMLGDCKPGDVVNFRVVSTLEDEVEVEYISHEKEEEGEEHDDEPSMEVKIERLAGK